LPKQEENLALRLPYTLVGQADVNLRKFGTVEQVRMFGVDLLCFEVFNLNTRCK